MKIKKILTFVFAAALMTSCGNEDGPGGDGGNGGGTEHTEYFGVNMSGAEFGNVYPGVDGTHYGYPTKKDLVTCPKIALHSNNYKKCTSYD